MLQGGTGMGIEENPVVREYVDTKFASELLFGGR